MLYTPSELEVIKHTSLGIRERCTYASVNGRNIGVAGFLPQVETAKLFAAPELARRNATFEDCFVNEMIQEIDRRVADLQMKEVELVAGACPMAPDLGGLSSRGEASDQRAHPRPTIMEALNACLSSQGGGASESEIREIVAAGPGFGKTTLADRISLWLLGGLTAEGCSVDETDTEVSRFLSDSPMRIGEAYGKIPILLRCRDLDPKIVSSSGVKPAIIHASLSNDSEALDGLLGALGKCDPSRFVLVIDGLDELPSSCPIPELMSAVSGLFRQDGEGCRRPAIFATTRDSSLDASSMFYLFASERFSRYEAVALNQMISRLRRMEFIYRAAKGWYACRFGSDLSSQDERARAFCKTIDRGWNVKYSGFLRTPLDLTLLLALYSNVEIMPANEHDLFMTYVRCRLRWRRGWAQPDDLLLQLSYIASRMVEKDEGGRYAFRLSAEKDELLGWIRDSYIDLGSRLESPGDKGFSTLSEAAESDLNDLVNVHGILSGHYGTSFRFEHRILHDFLMEDALVLGACPDEFSACSYSECYSMLQRGNALEDDWGKVYCFFVQDPRIGRDALRDLWKTMAATVDPHDIQPEEARVFSRVLLDGRILEEENSGCLDSLLGAFARFSINSLQFPVLQVIATDVRYRKVLDSVKNLYEGAGNTGEYSFFAATLDVFKSIESSRPKDESTEWGEDSRATAVLDGMSLSETARTRSLQCIEMVYFFRQVGSGVLPELDFARRFFDDGDEECNSFVSKALAAGLESIVSNPMAVDAGEVGRILGGLCESRVCRDALRSSLENGKTSLDGVLASYDSRALQVSASPSWYSSPRAMAQEMMVVSVFTGWDSVSRESFDARTYPNLAGHIEKQYRGVLERIGGDLCGKRNDSQRADCPTVQEPVAYDRLRDPGYIDGSAASLIERVLRNRPVMQPPQSQEDDPFPTIMERFTRAVGSRSLASYDIDDCRIMASVFINAEGFGIAKGVHTGTFLRRLTLLVLNECSKREDVKEFGYPGETLKEFCCAAFWD